MHEFIVSVVVFHTLSTITLLAVCAAATFARPRHAAPVWIDAMEVEADALLSAPAAANAVSSYVPARADSASVAAA